MRRHWICGPTLVLVLLLVGCAARLPETTALPMPSTKQDESGPTAPPAPMTQPSAPAIQPPDKATTTLISENTLARHVEEQLRSWGDPHVDPTAAEWLGVDEQDKLVVSGWIWVDDQIPEKQQKVVAWMADALVNEVRIREQWQAPAKGQRDSLYMLKRGGSTAQPVQVNGIGIADSGYGSWAEKKPLVQAWMDRVLGTRLKSLTVATSGSSIITAVLDTDGMSREELMQEAAILAAGLQATTRMQRLVLDYQGSDSHRVEVTQNLWQWVDRGGDWNELGDCLWVDGYSRECPSSYSHPEAQEWLTAQLVDRPILKRLLPSGASLTIGVDYRTTPTFAIDGIVPVDQSWADAWAEYARTTDQLFATVPELWQVYLTLRRADEADFFLFTRPSYRMRLFLEQQGIPLGPDTLPLSADVYRRYRMTGPVQ